MIGVDVVDVVLILRTRKAVEQFSSPRLSLGGELSITAGPVGNGVMLETGIELQPVWSYVKSKVSSSCFILTIFESKKLLTFNFCCFRDYGEELVSLEIY